MLKKIFLLFFLSLVFLSIKAQTPWPEITQTAKPWTRWWWQGSAVDTSNLAWNLQQYQQAGLGGVEITPIYGVHGYENRFIDFLSPKWMEMFQYTLNESKKLGLGVDLANATGWPFGGPWVTDADASKTIYYKIYHVDGGQQLKEPVTYHQQALVRTANNKPAAIDSIVNPVSANKNLQSLALDQIQYPGELPLQCLVAYNDTSILELTNKVNASGELNWTAPPGQWTLYALFQGLHGKMVERAAPGGEGYAIDHFSKKAIHDYLQKFDEAFAGHDLSYLRGFFNDSYEVDDARGQANWTPGFFDAFKKIKGYDLKNYLPALFGKDDPEKISRVIYDYRSVIDELILNDFTKQWKDWAASKNKIVRNQSHGSPANTLDLYSVVDIPETEGNDILRFKFATSAANVMGKKLVSSESATWLNEHFLSSLADVKKAIDLYFLGGVNHIFYHGSAYSPKDAPWPGWLFYAAVHFQPTNPQWKDFHVLNQYIARVQSFLQQGKPDNDILLYYPLADRYSEPGNVLLQHFDGMERNFENTDFERVSKWMLDNGYSYDFFSDRQLQHFTAEGNKVISNGNSYQCILLPDNKLIPEESMGKLMELAKEGAVILFYKNLPEDVPGFSHLEERRKKLQQLKQQLSFKESSFGIQLMKTGTGGAIAVGGKMEDLFFQFAIREENIQDNGLQFVRRKIGDDVVYFIDNRSEKKFDGWIELQTGGETVLLFNPMTAKSGAAKMYHNNIATTEVRLQLQPYESCILRVSKSSLNVQPYIYYNEDSSSAQLPGKWKIEFLTGGPKIPASIVTDKLGSWTEATDDARNFSGTAKYTISFKRPRVKSEAYKIDLGEVYETAEVYLNGNKIASLIGPTFTAIISADQLKRKNKLEIIVANLMANRIAYMDRNKIPWKIFYNTNMPARKRENSKNGLFDASGWKPLPSGILGPVIFNAIKIER
jgi:hypothetical protein